MADTIWTNGAAAASQNDWSVAANWSTAAVPIDNDVVIFDGAVTSAPVLFGLDQVLIDLDFLHILRSYSGDIGRRDDPLKISADYVLHRGSGALFYDAGTTTTTDRFTYDSDYPDQVQLDGRVQILNVKKGDVLILSNYGSGLTNEIVNIAYRDDVLADAQVSTISGLTNHIAWLNMNGGRFTGEVTDTARVFLGGGVYTAPTWADNFPLFYVSGGTVIWNALTSTSPNFFLFSGAVDFSGDSRAKTIGTLVTWPGSRFISNGNLTVSSRVQLEGTGPELC